MSVLLPLRAGAAELVVFETPSCAWCIKWQRDIGTGYGATRAARLMPLRQVDMQQPLPPDLGGVAVAEVPTFVVRQCGREVGRIVGYSTRAAFWDSLTELARRIPAGGC